MWSKTMQFDNKLVERAGRTLVLKCPAEGRPTPSIEWFKDGKPLLKDRPIGRVSTRVSDCNY